MKTHRLLFVVILVTTALISNGQQSKTAVEKSFLQAREVLDAGIKAMGGLQELQNIADITRELSGIRSDEGQGAKPVWPRVEEPPVTNRPKAKSVRDIRGGRTYDDTESLIFGGQPVKFRNVLTGQYAFSTSEISKNIREVPAFAINNSRAFRFRRHPEGLLLAAWSRPEVLRWIGDGEFKGRKQNVISFTDSDGSLTSMYFDAETKLLTKTESLSDDPIFGDTIVEAVYDDWKQVGKVLLPFRYIDRVAGSTLQDLHASTIVVNTKPPDSLFAQPEGYEKVVPSPGGPSVKKLADDVYAIVGGYNSIFVVFNDYVLVAEAGANSRSTAAAIAEIKKIAPNKPIRYLISTHFHFDHLGGVRSYIAEGSTIVTTQSARSVIERAATATHFMRPDRLSMEPKAPVIETINDKRVFEDGKHRVELYKITSPHVAEMILVYLPNEKVLLEADILDIPEAGTPPAGDDTVDLANQLQKLGLAVDTIVPVHGRIGTLADLKLAVSNRNATSSRN